jgi:penicillin V acylase-like amidase (Ntn superfamily)
MLVQNIRLTGLLLSSIIASTLACSRVTYTGAKDGRSLVGRSMDWLTPTNSSIYAFPPGLKRDGAAGNNSLQWTSKYGSVITTAYDLSTCDGMNERGLVANLLYLADAEYGPRNHSMPAMSLAIWPQYFLDQYATVAEAAKDLFDSNGNAKFQVRTRDLIPGVSTVMHVALSDASGDNLILEWINGKLVVHHGTQYNVMTNEPSYDQQLAINEYWSVIGNYSLPGTDRPADRFARLSHYVEMAPDAPDWVSALATTAGMIRAVSVPMEPINVNTPNITPTLWRTFADTKDLVYYYESASDGMYFYVDLKELKLGNSLGHTMQLPMVGVNWTERVGDMSGLFRQAEPFKFMAADN